MTRWMRRFMPLVYAVAVLSPLMVRAQDNANSRAQQELNAFVKKFEEGDALFHQKKYAEAAANISAAHALYQSANRRDENIRGSWLTIAPQTFPAMRFYGYIEGLEGSLKGEMADPIKVTAAVIHNAALVMWRDASILSNADKGPLAIALSDPPMEELSEDRLLSVADDLYGKIRRVELPVPDREWYEVVVAGRRALLVMEHLLRKYPAVAKQADQLDRPANGQRGAGRHQEETRRVRVGIPTAGRHAGGKRLQQRCRYESAPRGPGKNAKGGREFQAGFARLLRVGAQ